MQKPKKAPLIMSIALASALAAGTLTAQDKDFKRMEPAPSKNMIEVVEKKTNADIADNAEKYLGMPYYFGGRNTAQNPGIDCLGLAFRAIQDTYGKDWKEWSVLPSKLIRQVGKGSEKTFYANEVTKEGISSNFKKGDVLFFLMPYENKKDVPVRQIDYKDETGQKQKLDLWVWHVAIYAGDGKIIHASAFDQNYAVVKEDLHDFFKRNKMSGVISAGLGGE